MGNFNISIIMTSASVSVQHKMCFVLFVTCWICLCRSVVSTENEADLRWNKNDDGDGNVGIVKDINELKFEVKERLDVLMDEATASNDYPKALVFLEEGMQYIEHHNELDEVLEFILDAVVKIYSTAGYILIEHASSQYIDPKKRQSYLTAVQYYKEGLRLVEKFNCDLQSNQLHFWRILGQAYLKLKQSCTAAHYYELIYNEFDQDLSVFPEKDRMDAILAYGSCWPDKGVEMWDQMFQKDLLSVQEALKCRRCWLLLMTAYVRSKGGIQKANDLFNSLKIKQHTPYEHPLQVPPIFNTALITTEPKPFLNPKDFEVCRRLESNKEDIMQEYKYYRHKVKRGDIVTLYDQYHDDIALNEGGGWEGLYLRRIARVAKNETKLNDGDIGWQTTRCDAMFPTTCRILSTLPEVDGRLLREGGGDMTKNCGNHDNSGHGQNWCWGYEGQLPGVVGFWSLQPGSVVRMHAGSTNQRLKCHLVIDDGGGGSYIQVGGIRRPYVTGEVLVFDDSFLHVAENGGSAERVILDVTFFHPLLMTDKHPPPPPEEPKWIPESDPLTRITRSDL